MSATRFRYSPWDGTQTGYELDADAILDEAADDLVYHGDLNAALRRMMNDGFTTRDGRRISGLRDLLDAMRRRRDDILDRHNLGGVFDEIARELREIVDAERDGLAEEDTERRMQLELLPDDLAGRVRALQQYPFADTESAQRFERLLDRLRRELMTQTVDRMSAAVRRFGPEDKAHLLDMLAELNQMLADREAGREPDFDSFMERFGDLFPEDPTNLDELLETMARRMSAMSALMNSMTPEQRRQLMDLSDELMADMDLQWQMDQLGGHLRSLFPRMGWQESYEFSGMDPLDLAGALDAMSELDELGALEQILGGSPSPSSLDEIDLERVRDLLGRDEADSIDQLRRLSRSLEEAGLAEQRDGRLEMTPEGLRRLAAGALEALFTNLDRDLLGGHDAEQLGVGHERTDETKPYEWGDPFNLDIGRTVANAVAAGGVGTPVRLGPEDFEIERTRLAVRTSTVLMLDLSLSMEMRGTFLPAKRVALALHALISGRFPRDDLAVVGFGKYARLVAPTDIPTLSWDYDYGTNIQHALMLARRFLAGRQGTRQIVMITDGEPTAILDETGIAHFDYPPTRDDRRDVAGGGPMHP
ncbi:MAG: VWA domain-containing protein [Microthrixaceae bacterium]